MPQDSAEGERKMKKSYRDQLMQQIKDVGQEIIDRAEDMVGDGTNLITSFMISVDFPQGESIPIPIIKWETGVACRKTLEARRESIKGTTVPPHLDA